MSLRTTLSDIFHERTNYDFVGPRRRWFTISAAVILLGLVSLVTRGLNFGIDFEGGTAWQVTVEGKEPSTAAARDLLEANGVEDPEVVVLGGGVAGAGAALFDPLARHLDAMEWRPLGAATPVVAAALGTHAGAFGAARFAITRSTS